MARTQQILPLTGPMVDVVDRDALGTEKGLVRKRVNMRPDLTGNTFANLPIPGTVAASMVLPAGENKTLGWCNDNENEAIIWCVWNANQAHSVFRFFTLKNEVQRVFYNEPTLGFTADTNISCEVIDGRFYWNDNTDEPKSFNIEKAVNYTNGTSGDAYTESDKPFNTKVFPYCKKPPRFKPEISYESLTEFEGQEINFNNLRKKLWQAKYCFVYEDDQESVYSPISKVPLPLGELSVTGVWNKEITRNNALKITVDTGGHNVKKIKVAIRDASTRNIGPFYQFIEIEKFDGSTELVPSDSTHDAYFLNNTYLESIDNDYGNAYYHDVPLAAKDLILLDGKYVAMSMPKIGYDFDKKSLDYSVSYNETDTDFSVVSVPMESSKATTITDPWNECGLRGTGRTRILITIPEFEANAVYRISFRTPDVPIGGFLVKQPEVTASYVAPAVKPVNWPKPASESLIEDLINGIDSCYSIPIKVRPSSTNPAHIRFDFYYGPYINFNPPNPVILWQGLWKPLLDNYRDYIFGSVVIANSAPTYKSLKKGQYHPFAVVYNDENGRYNAAFGDEKIFIPTPDTSVDPDGISKIYTPRITISSLPPDWAHTYRIAYIPRNSYTYLQQVPAVEVIDGDTPLNGVQAGYKFLKINQAILNIIDEFPDSLIEAYVWEKGDRIRQVGNPDSFEILGEYTRNYEEGEETKVETGFLVKGDFTYMNGTDKIELVEIYRPNLTPQDKVYYEIGEEYQILNPGTAARRHEGNTQSQTSSLPAIIDLDFGDVYFRARFSSEVGAGYALVEDFNYADYYYSSGIDIGRGVVRTELKQEILKRVVKSENYIENTELNRLNIMLPGSENYSVSEVYGDISRIVERGDTLKIIQAHKEISVYIGKNYAKDGAGGDIVLNTDNTFGSDNVYDEYLGCKRPRAVGTMGRNVYFFDEMTADWCRSAVNGTISLTKQYGYDKYFSRKSKEFREYTGSKNVLFGCEPDLQTVYLTFIIGSSAETIAFSENPSNQGFLFIAEFSNGPLIPEYHAWYGEYLYSFVNGRLFIHGNGEPNSFFGSARKMAVLETVTNQYPQIRKTFEFMSLDANGQWNAEFEIEADNNYTSIQKTKILSPMFLNREGVLTSSVPRNLVNGNGVEDINRLYDGNKMSGNAMKIKISSANFDILRNLTMTAITQK